MQYEVEQKHQVDLSDGRGVEDRLLGFGAKLGESVEQSDQYFAHPSKDFARTDEALRIRSHAGESFVTYKGPKIDQVTKTRREIELPLGTTADGERFAELLQALGFTPVATVTKRRRPFWIEYAGRTVEGAYDVVSDIGTFIELELKADDSNLEETKRTIGELAQKLDLGPSIRSSYLEMLLAKKV